jgi:hypothetical protein
MYWYKPRYLNFRFAVLALIICFSSCKPEVHQSNNSYFNLSSYFKQEAEKYQHGNFYVVKTVLRNGESETKKVKIGNWAGELSVFSESDINKPSWKNSYKTTTSGQYTIYTAKEPDLKTREIIEKKENNKLVSLMIFNVVSNKLFQTREKLSYYPDSLYIIQRKLNVRFLGENNYLIKGKLK